MFQVTSLYAGILAGLATVLSNMVSARRGKTGVSILHGDDMDLALLMRRYGNFMEVIPLALLMMGLAEARGASPTLLHAMGIILIMARLMHLIGLDVKNAKNPLRIAGGVGSQLSLLLATGFLFWSLWKA